MTYEFFKKAIREAVQSRLPEGCETQLHTILKNNGTCLDALIIRESQKNISPTIYLRQFYQEYQNGAHLEQLANHILSLYEQHRFNNRIDLSPFQDFHSIKSSIVFRLINYKENEELLQDIPHIPYLDLAIVFYDLFSTDSATSPALFQDNCASMLIHNHLLSYWHITQEQLFLVASRNTPKLFPHKLCNLTDLVDEYLLSHDLSEKGEFCNEDLENDLPIYVLTNDRQIHGAGCMLYSKLLEKYAEKWHRDLYVIPSSIHEVLLVPDNKNTSSQELEQIVREVNATQVEQEDFLSNHVYYFSRTAGQLTLPG